MGGWLFAEWFLAANEANNWIPIPDVVMVIPGVTGLPEGILVKIIFAIVFMVVAYGLISLAYSIFFPLEPGEHDAPPVKRR